MSEVDERARMEGRERAKNEKKTRTKCTALKQRERTKEEKERKIEKKLMQRKK